MPQPFESEPPGPDPMLPRRAIVTRHRKDTADTFTIELEEADRSGGSSFFPGQFNMIYVFGTGEVPISIAGTTGKRLIHTTREVGTVTRRMSKLRRGDQVGIRGPFGSRWPLDEAAGKDVVIVAGGIGIAALHSALGAILARRNHYNHVALLYGSRTPAEVLYRAEFGEWCRQGLELLTTVDRGTPEWRGNVGVVTTLISRLSFDPRDCIAMMCGPEVMMRFTALELRKHGIADASMFLSMERNMKCAIGFCGHCQFGPEFICKEGPVFRCDRVRSWLNIPEL